MDFLILTAAMLAAFFLGAHVRKPFNFNRRRADGRPSAEPAPQIEARQPRPSALAAQFENLMNYGVPGKKQKGLNDYED